MMQNSTHSRCGKKYNIQIGVQLAREVWAWAYNGGVSGELSGASRLAKLKRHSISTTEGALFYVAKRCRMKPNKAARKGGGGLRGLKLTQVPKWVVQWGVFRSWVGRATMLLCAGCRCTCP